MPPSAAFPAGFPLIGNLAPVVLQDPDCVEWVLLQFFEPSLSDRFHILPYLTGWRQPRTASPSPLLLFPPTLPPLLHGAKIAPQYLPGFGTFLPGIIPT